MKNSRCSRVVVGVGESLSALQALRFAVAEARRRNTLLRAVRVWHVDVPWHGVEVNTRGIDAGDEAVSTIQRAFDRAMGSLPRNLDIELIAVEGAVGPTLVAQASNDDDLLIVGAPIRRWWSPSGVNVVRYCVRTAPCPVVVVPAPALAREYGVNVSARAIQREAQRYIEAGGQAS
jgi:nucleotide-binding universal stress UspA family protein